MRTAILRAWGTSLLLAAVLRGAPSASAQEPAPAEEAPPPVSLAVLGEARGLLAGGKAEAALRLLSDPSLENHPLWEYVLVYRARALSRMGRTAEAEPLWRRLFEALPEPSFRREAAEALLASLPPERLSEAVPYAKALWFADPSDVPRGCLLARALWASDRKEEAGRVALDLWTRFPGHPEAEKLWKDLPALAPRPGAVPREALLERLRAEARGGRKDLLERELPAFAPATEEETGWKAFLEGRREELSGQVKRALVAYRRAFQTSAVAPLAVVRMALVAPRASLTEESLRQVEEALLALPSSAAERDRALWALVQHRTARKEEPRALEVALRGLGQERSDGRLTEFLYDAAWARWMAKRSREAEVIWRRMVASLPPQADDRLASAYCLLRMGRISDPVEREALAAEILKYDAFGYFGYRLREGRPPDTEPGEEPAPPPGQPGSRLYKAACLRASGLPEEAAAEYLASGGPLGPSTAARWAAAQALLEAGRTPEAIREARRAYPQAYAAPGRSAPETFWRAVYPLPFLEEVKAAAGAASLPPLLLGSVARQESLWDPQAVSRSGALGLLQLMPPTARTVALEAGLPPYSPDRAFDPAWNLSAGSRYLASLLGRYRGRLAVALAAYNAGPGRADEWLARPGAPKEDDLWIESIPFRETRSYVRRILLNLWEYSRLYPGLRSCASIPPEQRPFYSPSPELLCPPEVEGGP